VVYIILRLATRPETMKSGSRSSTIITFPGEWGTWCLH